MTFHPPPYKLSQAECVLIAATELDAGFPGEPITKAAIVHACWKLFPDVFRYSDYPYPDTHKIHCVLYSSMPSEYMTRTRVPLAWTLTDAGRAAGKHLTKLHMRVKS